MTSAFMPTNLNFRMQEIEVKLADIFHAGFLPGAAMMILTYPNAQLHLHFQKYPGVKYSKIRELFQQTLLTRVADHIYFAPRRQPSGHNICTNFCLSQVELASRKCVQMPNFVQLNAGCQGHSPLLAL